MTLIGFGLNLLLAALLIATLVVGVRLSRRLNTLRDSQEGFASAVRDLDAAARRAEQGLADLRAATDEAVDLLADRIEKGRVLATKLERLTSDTPIERRSSAPVALDESVEQRLGVLLAAAREARARPERLVAREPLVRREAVATSTAFGPDEDLFEDEPLTLDRFAEVRR
jgi:Domain of unknown function (DUF6468)